MRAYRVLLSSRMLGKLYHAEGVERRIRNSLLGAKSPEEFQAFPRHNIGQI